MSTQDKEPFISRWSRRKLDSAKEGVAQKPAAPSAAAAPVATKPAAKAELPSIDSLRGLVSEYRDFLRPGVDEKLRQAALKKLFHDPHFNVMDGLDTYIDDYSKSDPIPEAMLRTLAHAKGLLFDEEKPEAQPPAPGEKPVAAAAGTEGQDKAGSEAPAQPPAPEAKA